MSPTSIPGVVYCLDRSVPAWVAPGRESLPASVPVEGPGVPVAGALPIGTASYDVPAVGAMFVSTTGSDGNPGTVGSPKATLSGAINAASSGDTVVLRGGTYGSGYPSNLTKSLTIQNYPGEAVWFDGSQVVTGFTGSGPYVRTGWTVKHDHSTSFTSGDTATRWIDPAFPLASWPDMLFVDGIRQTLVDPAATPSAGQWCHDYATNTIKMGSNPAGKEVRVAVEERFTIVKNPDTVFRGIGIRRFAAGLSQIGTIFGSSSGPRTIIENCWFIDCGQQSVSLSGAGSTVRNTSIIRPGCTGFHSSLSSGITVKRVWVDQSNYRRFKNEPAAASIKLTEQRDCLITESVFTGGFSYGIWFDTDTINITITHNKVSGHTGRPIIVEAGDKVIVAGNWVDANGANYGIMNTISSRMRVWNNTIDNTSAYDIGVSQDARRNVNPATKAECPWIITQAEIVNNVMTFKTGTGGHLFQAYVLDKETGRPAASMVSLLAGNLFSSTDGGSTSNRMIGWGGSDNTTVTIYKTPAAFKTGVGQPSWDNSLTPYMNPTDSQVHAYDTAALPLPADIAATLGVPAGTRIVGPVQPAPILAATTP